MMPPRWFTGLRVRLRAPIGRSRLERERGAGRQGSRGFGPWPRRRAERDIRREIDLHLDLETQQNIEQGMAPAEAARAARAALGNVPLIREDVRAVWRWRWLDQLLQDVRCGARSLRRDRGFTAMSVTMLALTIGATAAIFSVVHGVLLRPLPVAEPDRLVRILNIGYIGELLELRERARTFDVSAYAPPGDRTLTGLDEPLRLSVVPLAGDLLARLDRTPAFGPGFRLDDERPGAAPAAILSHALWRQPVRARETPAARGTVRRQPAQPADGAPHHPRCGRNAAGDGAHPVAAVVRGRCPAAARRRATPPRRARAIASRPPGTGAR